MNIHELLTSIEEFDGIIGGISTAMTTLPETTLQRRVTGVVNDHQAVTPETIFVAISGTSVDSHEYIPHAREKGAALVIGEHSSSTGVAPDLIVKNARAAIGPLASVLLGSPSEEMNLVGITGTNGKTTTSYLYSSIVSAHNKHCFTMGTTGILVDGEKESDSQTTPDPLIIHKYFSDFHEQGINSGALEVSSHALDQYRVLGTRFAAVAFTNFTQDHLDYHDSMDQYFAAKAQLFSTTYAPEAVVNIDDLRGHDIAECAKKNGQNVTRVSCKDVSADIFVEAHEVSLSGSQLVAHIYDHDGVIRYPFSTPLIGDFNYENIAVALGLARVTRCDMETSIAALKNPDTVPGRLQRTKSKTGFSVFVDYAHTPDALARVLTIMKPLAKNLIVVFGCGGDRDSAKRPLMGKIASELADVVIVTSDNPRSEDPVKIIDEIVTGVTTDAIVEVDRRTAIKLALSKARTGDAVIVAGKGHEQGQIFSDRVEEFSDSEVVNEILTREL